MANYKKLLIAVDLSEDSPEVAERARGLAEGSGAELHLIHVIEPLSFAYGGDIPMDTLMSEGEEIYNSQCAACHQADGSGMPAAGFPAMKGSEIATGSLDEHIDRVLNGKGAMPAYKDGMSDRKIAAVITFERNAFGNDTGDAIQPSQIKAKR